MERRYYADLLQVLANRANLGAVSSLGFANAPLRRHLAELFQQPYGTPGSFLSDPTFEAVFGWQTSTTRMSDLSGKLLSASLIEALDSPPKELAAEYRFAKGREPYTHQIEAWQILGKEAANSLVVTSGTGSGKTECFMIPILDRLVRERDRVGGQLIGVRALFLYPLNALINSQRDRFRAWTHHFGGDIRFCLYNGATPEVEKATSLTKAASEVLDRKTLRATPPPMLITNATMLEYMLLRTQDANILAASQGKLEWIVLDEAHSYIGSQAAELALLIRRVVHAFGVQPENLRFVATSATIGDPKGEAGLQLRQFLAQVAGVDVSRVFLVAGSRMVPELAQSSITGNQAIDELWKIDEGETATPGRYAALEKHAIARGLRDLFVKSDGPPVARLSDVSARLSSSNKLDGHDAQEQALNWLDLLSSASTQDGTSFLPLRGHLFHQTLPGLWACADGACKARHKTALDSASWPFGKVFLSPRNFCTCGSPAYEVVCCEECGEIFLTAESNGNKVVSPASAESVDEFSLDIEAEAPDTGDENAETDVQSRSRNGMLIVNRALKESGVLHIDRQTRQIVEANVTGALAMTVVEDGGSGLDCPACQAASQPSGRLFRKGRIGAPFMLGGILPSMLEFAPDGENAPDRPYRGRRLLTFSDSRQGTARLSARLQQDAERSKTRGYIYHHTLNKLRRDTVVADPASLAAIADLEKALATPGMPESAKALLVKMLEGKRAELTTSPAVQAPTFPQLQTAISQEGRDFQHILHDYKIYSRAVFGSADGPGNLAGMLIVREMGRRPKRQNNLETMGLISVQYPKLLNVASCPPDWSARGFTVADWRDFLKLVVDYFVRGGGSLDIPDTWRNWLGIRFPRNWIVSPDELEASKTQRRWPSARRARLQSLPVRLLANLLHVDVDTPIGQDSVDVLLRAAWRDIAPLLEMTGSGWHLPLRELSFLPMSDAWVCPYTRRFLDTTLRGTSPYLPKSLVGTSTTCEKVQIPVYDRPFGEATDSTERVRRAREWMAAQPQVDFLRSEGLWSSVNDRVLEFASYFATAEHSAQQSTEMLKLYEKQFKDGQINVLSCSTTMEMGIDIGGVQMVAMNNVPPHPANYLQRAGRAGRRREPRSVVVTLCKANPHDQNVAADTRWAFAAKLPAPVVSLNSGIIVQRHVNSMVLAHFLKGLLRTNKQDINKLTCGWFYAEGATGPANRCIAWCDAYFGKADPVLNAGLKQLVRRSVFEGRPPEALVRQSGIELSLAFGRWQGEWTALLEQEAALGPGGATDPAAKAIAHQKRRLSLEYLLRELAVQGFLPAYGFPTSIASFDNTTVSSARELPAIAPDDGSSTTSGRDDNRFRKRELPSRDLVSALREYAPGADIVMDGLVYRSAGITLNWHIPANQEDAKETQALKLAWRCSSCGASGTTLSLQSARSCSVCGETVEATQIQEFLEPAGFSVDFYEDPHNNVATQTFVPVERPWLSARGNWSALPNPALGRFRSTTEGRVYHHSSGANRKGYALCLACGRAEPMGFDGKPPKIFEPGNDHKKLRSRKEDRICPGSSNRWAIKQGIVLGQESRTDVLELQLRDASGQWLKDKTTALTIGVAFRDSLAAILGVQTSELGCDVQETRAEDQRCQSIFIFDRNAAGYTSSADQMIGNLFRSAAKRLDCPSACDSSCPHCVLDFDQRFDAVNLDRHAALAFLKPEWLDSMRLPAALRYFGDSSQVEVGGLVAAVLRESGQPDAGLTRLYAGGQAEQADIATSPLRLLAFRLAAMSRQAQIVVDKVTFEALSEEERFCLAGIAEHPGLSVAIANSIPAVSGANVIADVMRGPAQVVWAASETTALVPNGSWAIQVAPLVVGRIASLNESFEIVPAASIRPKVVDVGDREIVLHQELDGPLMGFGKRFWELIANAHPAASQLLADPAELLVGIEYSDRYLFTPLSVALLLDVVRGLKKIVGSTRNQKAWVTITTTNVRGSGSNTSFGKVFSDWTDTTVRNAVTKFAFRSLGIPCEVKVPDSSVQHGRILVLSFESGKTLTVRLDQGISYWRTSNKGGAAGKPYSTYFNFNESDPQSQAKSVTTMEVPVVGGTMPTELFVKVRTGVA